MRATVEPLEGNRVKLSVEVDESEFEQAVDSALRKIARDVRIPGFRPGKAPRRLLEARMGKATVRQEAMRDALPEYYAAALRQTEIDAIAPPQIDVTSGDSEGPLAFDAVVEVRPQVSLVGYQGLRVAIASPAVTDEDLERQIHRLRHSSGQLVEANRPAQSGDHLTLNLEGFRSGESDPTLSAQDYLYELGSGSIATDLDDRLLGAKPGDVVEFETTDGADNTVSFKVLVKDVKEMVLPEVTDEWASEASEFDTVAELEADLRRRMGEVKRVQATMAVREEALKALAELVDQEVPEPLVAAEMERRLHDLAARVEAQGGTIAQYLQATGQSQEQLLHDLRTTANDAVRADLALRALADAEGIEVTVEDVEAELVGLAERMDQSPAALREQLERVDQMPAVRADIRKTKALAWLVDHVEIVDEEGQAIDRAALEPPPEPAAEANSEAPTDDTIVEDTQ
ncbi:MAG: trigger factor [Actinobacteria bacterium]|nr:trigger factor [Actinomycetota bacterium]